MPLTLVTAPTVEPVTVTDIKSHLRIDTADDDTLLGVYITVARKWCEKFQNRAYITQTWNLILDDFPDGDVIEIPLPPLQSVSSITYYDTDDTAYTFSTDNYMVDTDSEPGRVVLKYAKTWPSITLRPANAVVIQFIAGYGGAASDVPEHIIHAIKMLVGHLYENRENTDIRNIVEVPFGVKALLWADRVVSI